MVAKRRDVKSGPRPHVEAAWERSSSSPRFVLLQCKVHTCQYRGARQNQNPAARAKCALAEEAMVNLQTLRSRIMQQQQQIEQGLAPTGSNQFAPDYRVDLDILKVMMQITRLAHGD